MSKYLKFIVLIISILCSSWSLAFSYTMEISESELQQFINQMMPLTHNESFVTIIVTNPKIDLMTGSEGLGVNVNLEAIAPGGMRGTGNAEVQGILEYNPTTGGFYLNNAKITHLDIHQIPQEYHPGIQQMAQVFMSRVLKTKPIYILKDNDLKFKLAKSFLESVKVRNEKLLIQLNSSLPNPAP